MISSTCWLTHSHHSLKVTPQPRLTFIQYLVDLQIQFTSSIIEQHDLSTYFEGIALFYERHPSIAVEAITRTNNVRGLSSFSMIFATLFYRVLTTSEQLDLPEMSKLRLYLIKGVNKLIE